ncbi:MAG: prepilin-type N-terminal cleavage/methylation domain-containing protein [Eubacteriales bacterium]|nr:prepilin-type N-terminal cleavage/methylation domain-containing protein [Eubacteriales bacterium]
MRTKRPPRSRRGMTLVEVLVAVAILALVAVPVLSVYLTSAQDITLSRRTTDATLTAQSLLENLVGLDYQALFDADTGGARHNVPISHVREDAGGKFWYTIDVRPYAPTVSSAHPEALRLFLYSDGTGVSQAFAAGPDGKTVQASDVTAVSLQAAGDDYHLILTRSAGSAVTLDGKCAGGVLLLADATARTADSDVRFRLTGDTKVRILCRQGGQDYYPVDNAAQYLHDVLLAGDELTQSPVSVTVRVYLDADITQPLATYSDILLVTGVGQ